MRCLKDYQLTQYLDGGYTPQEAEKIKSHLSTCVKCAGRLEMLRNRKDFVALKAEILDPLVYQTEDLDVVVESGKVAAGVMSIQSGWGMVKWAIRPVAAVVVLAVLIVGALVLGPQLFHREDNGANELAGNGDLVNQRDIVRYVRVDGEPAQTFIIKERESNTTIIWVEPK
jgi:anti-sigma factor RsiW